MPPSSRSTTGRVFIALAVFFRHVGLADEELSPRLRELATTRISIAPACSARRCGWPISSPPRPRNSAEAPLLVETALVLRFKNGLKDLAGERVFNRLRQLAA